MRNRSTYLPTLDGWRAVAISLVLFCHASVGIGTTRFKDIGLLGVHIFFGLSGFLITSLLLREEARTAAISLAGFYVRRAFRILPAALLFLAAAGSLALFGIIHVTFGRWISSLLFMSNYSRADVSWSVAHFWSLAVEEHFYFIWPSVLVFVRGSRRRLLLAVVAAIAVALWRAVDFKYHLTWGTDSAWFWGRTDIQGDAILFGVISALALADERIGPKVRFALERSLTAPLAILVVALTYVLPPHLDWKLAFVLITVRAAAIPVMILATLVQPDGMLGRLLERKPIRFIGVISYSLYLWNQLFLVWEPNPKLAFVQWFPMNLAAALVCAVCSFYLVETPAREVGRRILAWAAQRRGGVHYHPAALEEVTAP